MPNTLTPPDPPTSHFPLSKELIIELISLLKRVIENSGTGRTAEQMQELIVELSSVTRSMDKLNETLEKFNEQERGLQTLTEETKSQKKQISQIETKVSNMYSVIFEPDPQGA